MKNRACIGWTSGFCECLTRSLLEKESCEKYMLEAEESCQAVNFASVSRERPTREILAKLFAWGILSMTFLPFTHTIYTLITHKSMRGYSKRKTLDKFSTTQHIHLLESDLLILSEKSLCPILLPSPIAIPWEEICTQTQPTPIQSVKSVLELGKLWELSKEADEAWWMQSSVLRDPIS